MLSDGTPATPPPPDEDSYAFPASFAQARLWFLCRLDPTGAAYNMPFALQLQGALDVKALTAALDGLCARHESLRTRFDEVDGEVLQIVHPPHPLAVSVEDLSALPPAERARSREARCTEEGLRPMNLGKDTLIRVSLLRMARDQHVLLIVLHHIISDGWSMAVFSRELLALYAALKEGRPSPLPELEIQFVDYSEWQHQWMEGKARRDQASFWRKALAGPLPVLEFPSDRPRPPQISGRGGTVEVQVDAPVTRALQSLARSEGATLFMSLLASWTALLHRYTGATDIVTGTPVANRGRAEVEGLIGLFVNTLAIRTRVTGELTVTELVRRLRGETLEAYANQELPFDKVVEELKLPRDLSVPPVFQTMLVLENQPAAVLQLAGLEVSPLTVSQQTSKFDLTLSLAETKDGLEGRLEYNTDLFDAPTVERLVRGWKTLLSAFAVSPDVRLASLPLLTAAEREAVVRGWNRTERAYGTGTVHGLFEEQVRRHPDAVAVKDERGALTYRQLNEKANQVARRLRQEGVGAETRVGVCMERSVELVVALLGVLKAGGAYVPLDPAYPAERLKYIREDARTALVLTQAALTELFADSGEESVADLDVPVSPESLCYIIYTSGSTGHPKGALNAHHGVRNNLRWLQETYPLTASDVVLQKTPFTFDVSVWELFWPLTAGARLVMARPGGHRDSDYLVQVIGREQVTVTNFVPSMLQLFIEHREVGRCSSLTRILAAGEALPLALQEEFFAKLPGVELHNLYGPTEAAVAVSFWECRQDSPYRTVPIGRPIGNVQLYVLDASLGPVPVGVPGHLHIGGAAVGRGYWGRPAMTAEKFIPDPFSSHGGRLYRTGDRARLLPSGDIEYLGRLDDQVKVRGFRIELGEIEACLREQPLVREAVVVARDDAAGKHLVAYLVPQEGASPEVPELREALKRRLPDFMVPSFFVVIDQLPLNSSGKADRRALSLRDVTRSPDAEGHDSRLSPRNATEQGICHIWSELLRFPVEDVQTNFFTLGGHSLLAMRMVARLDATFQVRVPLAAAFEAPTVAQLAALVDRLRGGAETQASREPVVRQSRTQPLPLSFAQQRLFFLDRLAEGSAFYNIGTLVRLSGALELSALEEALRRLVVRHESLRTTYQLVDGEALQTFVPPGFALERLEISGQPGNESALQEVAVGFVQRRFDLGAELPFRAGIIRLGDREHGLVLSLHHIAVDGWSIEVMLRDAAGLYTELTQRSASSLPELPFQYADFAVWQQRWWESGAAAEQLRYWAKRLEAPLPVLDLPADRPRPPFLTDRGQTLHFSLPLELAQRIQARADEHQVTLFVYLLTGFKALLARYARQEDIIVGTPIAGRNLPGTENVVGCFINTLVLRSDLSGNPPFAELLDRVKRGTVEAFRHAEVPFERLVEHLAIERSTAHPPVFQAMFVLNEDPAGEARFPGLEFTEVPLDAGTSTFDVTFSVIKRGANFDAALEFSTDLFDASSMERLFEAYCAILEEATGRAGVRLRELRLVSARVRDEVLAHSLPAHPERMPGHSMVSRLLSQVERTPDRTAVVAADGSLTYRELLGRADSLARELRAAAVRRGDRVGVCLERALSLPVSLLAIFRAGASYVPLDPRFPVDRLQGMAEDAQLCLILTEQQCVSRVEGTRAPRFLLDARPSQPLSAAGALSLPEPLEEAYVLYTSGSTGKPKGVSVPHGALANFLDSMQEQPGLAAVDVLLAITTLSFDIAALELYLPLMVGARVVIASREETQDMVQLEQALERAGATVMQATPTTWRALLDSGWKNPRRIAQLCGGELLAQDLAARLLATGGALWNLYGPTETTVWSTLERVSPEGPVTAGRPVLNTSVLVLDDAFHPVPPRVAGAVYIGGVGVALGYVGRPDLTAERFVPDPFSRTPGARLYATGDLGRQLPDGRLQVLGREDFQVKIRGHRIEVGEVESALRRQPDVLEAAVVARELGAMGLRLVGYVVPRPGVALSSTVLRSALEQELPGYMVPSFLEELPELPMTLNRKVDRKALQARPPPAADTGGGAFQNEREELLARLWTELLGAQRLSSTSSFFALGGDSIVAMQLAARLRQEGLSISPADVFQHATLAGLAQHLATAPKLSFEAEVATASQSSDGLRPLTSMQRGMLFRSLLTPESRDYFEQVGFRIPPGARLELLRQAFSDVVQQYSALRTRLVLRAAPVPSRRIQAQVELPWQERELAGGPGFEAAVARFLEQDVQRGFDWEAEPLFRVTVLRGAGGEQRGVFSFHHLLLDGWSCAEVLRAVAGLYAAAVAGEPRPPLPADVPAAFEDWLEHQDLSQPEGFWRQRLAGLSSPTPLPRSQGEPGLRAGAVEYGRTEHVLTAAFTAQLRKLTARHSITANTLFQSCWALLLSRYSGESSVLFGSLVSGRSLPWSGISGWVGLFINTLPTRVDIPSGGKTSQWLAAVQAQQLQERRWEATPLPQLQRWSQMAAGQPLFESVVVYDPRPREVEQFGNESLSLPRTGFPLHLEIEPGEDFHLRLTFQRSRFDDDAANAVLEHYRNLLVSCLDQLDAPLRRVSLLSSAEREEGVTRWNRTERAYAAGTVHGLFEEQARRRPDAVAVAFEERTLTYRQLDEKANQLARRLRHAGVGAEVRVGVCMERSIELVVALLGVLKAGGAYVPLDPAYPADRLGYMKEDAESALVLTQERLLGLFPDSRAPVWAVDTQWDALGQESGAALDVQVSPESLCYIIYTSGSTGRPKGAMNAHRGVVNRLQWTQEAYGLTGDDVVLQKTPFSFDVSVWEFFWTLMTGAKLVMALPGGHKDSAYLARTIREERVTTLHFVPSMLQLFLEHREAETCRGIKRVICSGEALPWALQEELFAKLPGVELHNLYGPTEAAVDVSFWACRRDSAHRTVPIGKPIANVQLYVLDEALEPAPVGVPGHLHIGGVGVGRGYWRRPAMTAEKFIPDPFSSQGGRLYRTGDLARRMPSGDIDYLGRLDDQVKVRGFRIELGEIETCLREQPYVREAVVVARDDAAGKHLVAYLVPQEGEALGVPQLRETLKQRLPDFMIPSFFVVIAQLPLSLNGKVDRKALPAPQHAATQREQVAPRDALEARLLTVFRELLGDDTLDITDDFFARGGHSMLALRLIGRIERELGATLPVALLFAAPTVEKLASQLRDRSVSSGESALVPLALRGDQAPLFCIHPVGGNVMCYQRLSQLLDPSRPVYAFQSEGLLRDGVPQDSIEAMASAYLAEMRRVQPRGPYRLAGWSMGGVIAFELARQLERVGERVELLALIDSTAAGFQTLEEGGEETWFAAFALELGLSPGELSSGPADSLDALQTALRGLNPAGEAPSLDQLRRLWTVFRANSLALSRYQPEHYSGSVTLLVASDRPYDAAVGEWSQLAPRLSSCFIPDTTHHSLLAEPAVAAVARVLNS